MMWGKIYWQQEAKLRLWVLYLKMWENKKGFTGVY